MRTGIGSFATDARTFIAEPALREEPAEHGGDGLPRRGLLFKRSEGEGKLGVGPKLMEVGGRRLTGLRSPRFEPYGNRLMST